MNQYRERLEEQLQSGLPGWTAQRKMIPATAMERKYHMNGTNNTKDAAVMLLLENHPNPALSRIVFIKRSFHPKDKHSGQISFPGGRLEHGETLAECALRETAEELGIEADGIRILGRLSPLHVWVSSYLVHPFVGSIQAFPEMLPNDDEVQEIIMAPISHFCDSQNIIYDTRVSSLGRLQEVPGFTYESNVIWGATAMIFAEFLEVWNKTGLCT